MIILRKKKRATMGMKIGTDKHLIMNNIIQLSSKNEHQSVTSPDTSISEYIKGLALKICQKNAIPFIPSIVPKFRAIYDNYISKLECYDENIAKIYLFAFIYKFTKSSAKKGGFIEGFNVKVLDRAIKQLGEWNMGVDSVKEENDVDEKMVCNLYKIV